MMNKDLSDKLEKQVVDIMNEVNNPVCVPVINEQFLPVVQYGQLCCRIVYARTVCAPCYLQKYPCYIKSGRQSILYFSTLLVRVERKLYGLTSFSALASVCRNGGKIDSRARRSGGWRCRHISYPLSSVPNVQYK